MADEEIPQLDHPRLRETGNGPGVSYEEALLREFYGEPDEGGVYGGESRFCKGTAEQWANCACTTDEDCKAEGSS